MHRGIFGRTNSGKSFLAKNLADKNLRDGKNVQIIDPTGSFPDAWENKKNCFYVDEINQLNLVPSFIYADEAGSYLRVRDLDNHWLLTEGRHYGFLVTVISQRPKMVAPNIRSQLTELFIFMLAEKDAGDLASEYDFDPKIVTDLRQGEFLHIKFNENDGVYKKHLHKLKV
jgi:hypothetical protein